MTTPAVAAPEDATLGQAIASAEKRLAVDWHGSTPGAPEPEPAPAEPAEPEEPAAAEGSQPEPKPEPTPEPEPEAEPTGDGGAPPEPTATVLDPKRLSAAAITALRHEGWKEGEPITDALLQQALEKKLDYNNRLAAQARGERPPEPEGEAPGEPAEPVDPSVLEVELDERMVIAAANQALDQSPQVRQLVAEHQQAQTQFQQHSTREQELNTQIARAEVLMGLDEVKSDEYRLSEERNKLRELRAELREARADKREAQAEITRTSRQYDEWHQIVREDFRKYETNRLRQEKLQQNAEALGKHWEQEISVTLDPAIDRAMEQARIPTGDREEFDRQVRLTLESEIAASEDGLEIPQVEKIIGREAKRYAQWVDRHHRAQSAEYAKQAHQRSTVRAPEAPAAPAGTPSSQPPPVRDLKDVIKERAQLFVRGLRGAG
jgi:hypothetical protein